MGGSDEARDEAKGARTSWCSRLLLALILAVVVGTIMTPQADARKKGSYDIGASVARHRKSCDRDGGTFAVSERPGGTTTTGKTAWGGETWTHHSNGQLCHNNPKREVKPRLPLDDIVAPPPVGRDQAVPGGLSNPGAGAVAPLTGAAGPDREVERMLQ